MKTLVLFTTKILLFGLLLLLAACGPTVNKVQPQETVTVNKTFQAQVNAPTVPPYRCGAWAANTSPRPQDTLTVYAKMTKDVTGVVGATATAVVHFQGFDVTVDQQPTSDAGGIVEFTIPLMGRQPNGVPAKIDVSFALNGNKIQCTQAFFTPM